MEFDIATAGRVVFGPGGLNRIREWTAGQRVFVVTGKRRQRAEPLLQMLADDGVSFATASAAAEPATGWVVAAADRARRFGATIVVGMGGGSPVDAGKAVAALLTNHRQINDYLEVIGKALPLERQPAPYIAVPTTAGTGSEVTGNAVLTSTEHHIKVSLRSPLMLPRLAIVDPTLTYSMPAAITAATGMDALTQLLEAYVSRRANAFTDALCREGLVQAAAGLPRAWSNGRDARARERMCLASLFSGMALSCGGLGAVHGIAGPLGGMIRAPHGALCAQLLPHVMEANIDALGRRAPDSPAAARFREAAQILCGDTAAEEKDGVGWIRDLAGRFHLPSLSEHGLTQGRIPEVAAKAFQSSSMKGNPIPLTKKDIIGILEKALYSD
jgi:alcohol dehydrogenase class IV